MPFPWKQKLIGWMFVLLALPFGFFSVTHWMDKLASPSWPAAHAEVSTIDVHKRIKSGAWCIQMRYRYRIDDTSFASSRWSLSTKVACYRDRQVADTLSQRFRPGARIEIRYDPSDPGKSIVYLEGLRLSDFVFLITAVVLLAAGILVIKRRARVPADTVKRRPGCATMQR